MRFSLLTFALVSLASAIQLPIEVTGPDGTEVAVNVDLPPGVSSQARSLWLQVHGLEYEDLASVKVNAGPWVGLNNHSVSVAEPGKSYGGIGGGFATLKLTLPVEPGSLSDHNNTIHFRFNHTNGVVSGFRVLALNFRTAGGQMLLPPSTFTEEDPKLWQPPLPSSADIAAGKSLWFQASLTANGLANAGPIRAHCADCHASDGRDLKYFNYSNGSIIARSRFHGLSEQQGVQIASYIRSLNAPNPGRPWNPPYQPGPGLDRRPVADWAAGAGLSAVLEHDAETLKFLFPNNQVTPAAFRPDSDLNPRDIPIAMQLPDWNHWLPHVHPSDAWGERFAASPFARLYSDAAQSEVADVPRFFDDWAKARAKFLDLHLASNSKKWNAALSEKLYATQLWQLVKTWELTQRYDWEQTHTWRNTVAAATAPTFLNIPDTSAGMAGSGLTNEYFSSAWYQLQLEVNSVSQPHNGRAPLNWTYLIEHFRDLESLSGQPEPGRLLLTVIKALQSNENWRPERIIDPRLMVAPDWSPVFASLDPATKRDLTQSFLTAWLDKTLSYPADTYFHLGASASAYAPPPNLQTIAGGHAWESAQAFRTAGVDPRLVARLESWGKTYTSLAALFHY